MQTEQNESVTITLTPEEQELLLVSLESFQHLDTSLYQDQVLDHLEGLKALHKKLQFLFPNQSGDLCLHSEQSPDAVVQGDSICPKCSSTTGILLPTFQACSECFGLSVQSPDAVGQGDSICYQCEKRVSYLFDDSRCKDCTRLTPEEVQGNVQQGGTIECIDTIHCLCLACADHK